MPSLTCPSVCIYLVLWLLLQLKLFFCSAQKFCCTSVLLLHIMLSVSIRIINLFSSRLLSLAFLFFALDFLIHLPQNQVTWLAIKGWGFLHFFSDRQRKQLTVRKTAVFKDGCIFEREESHACTLTPRQAEQKIMVALWALRVSCLQGRSTLAPCCSKEQKMFPCKTLLVPFTPAQSSVAKIPLLT